MSAYGITELCGTLVFTELDDPVEVRVTTCGSPPSGLRPPGRRSGHGRAAAAGRARRARGARPEPFRGLLQQPGADRASHRRRRVLPHRRPLLDRRGRAHLLPRQAQGHAQGRRRERRRDRDRVVPRDPPGDQAGAGRRDPRRSPARGSCRVRRARPGASPEEEDVIGYCKGSIASFKVPRHVRFVEEWPMSATKVQKFSLRDQLSKSSGRRNERRRGSGAHRPDLFSLVWEDGARHRRSARRRAPLCRGAPRPRCRGDHLDEARDCRCRGSSPPIASAARAQRSLPTSRPRTASPHSPTSCRGSGSRCRFSSTTPASPGARPSRSIRRAHGRRCSTSMSPLPFSSCSALSICSRRAHVPAIPPASSTSARSTAARWARSTTSPTRQPRPGIHHLTRVLARSPGRPRDHRELHRSRTDPDEDDRGAARGG